MRVDQVMLLYIVFEAVEISGDVAWWLRFVGILVGVFVFSTILLFTLCNDCPCFYLSSVVTSHVPMHCSITSSHIWSRHPINPAQ